MLHYATPRHGNGVLVFKTHIQKWENNIGHLGGNNAWKKGTGALFGEGWPNELGNLRQSGSTTPSLFFL